MADLRRVFKSCHKCKMTKSVDQFHKSRRSKDGLQQRCKTCTKEYGSARVEEKKVYDYNRREQTRQIIREIKLRSGCVDCGYKEHHAALDFDHLPEFEKSFTISDKINLKPEALLLEIKKCEVVCSNCHRVRTYERLQVCQI